MLTTILDLFEDHLFVNEYKNVLVWGTPCQVRRVNTTASISGK